MRYTIRSWDVATSRMVELGTIDAHSPDNAVSQFRERNGPTPKRLTAVLADVKTNLDPAPFAVRSGPYVTPMKPPQSRAHHKQRRTKYTPAERFAIKAPGPKPAFVINLNKPSRIDCRFDS